MDKKNKKDKNFYISNLKYLNITNSNYKNYFHIEIADFESFKELLNFHKPQYLFKDEEFYVYINTKHYTTYLLKHNNFKNLVDYEDGVNRGFYDGKDYYDGIKRGFFSYDDYKLNKSLGYKVYDDYKNSEKLGFRNSLEEIKMIREKIYNDYYDLYKFLGNKINKEADVYYIALEKGFKDFNQFKEAILMGFINFEEYNDAKLKGFKDKNSYLDAKEKGFEIAKEYEEAINLGINNKEVYDIYKILLEIKNKYNLETMDEALLLAILESMEQNEVMALSKIWEIMGNFREKIRKIRRTWGGTEIIYPKWFSIKFNNIDDLINYMKDTNIYENLGVYNEKGEVFERKIQLDKCIIIDGSNVAWYGLNKLKGDKASIKNVEYMFKTLKGIGFRNIRIIIDASLKYQIDDKDKLNELINQKIIEVAPSHTDADKFIIDFAKEYNCKIITNDTFKDWKGKDKWVRENIESLRVSFMIDENGKVKFFNL